MSWVFLSFLEAISWGNDTGGATKKMWWIHRHGIICMGTAHSLNIVPHCMCAHLNLFFDGCEQSLKALVIDIHPQLHPSTLTQTHFQSHCNWNQCVSPSTVCNVSIYLPCVYSWWGPAPTCSAWFPSWCLSLFLSWSFSCRSSSNSSPRCCLPPSRRSLKRHVFMYAHWQTNTPTQPPDELFNVFTVVI